MRKILFFLVLITNLSIAQIPPGIDPSSVTKEDLEKYGVSEDDLKKLLGDDSKSDDLEVNAPAEINVIPVDQLVKEEVIKPISSQEVIVSNSQSAAENTYGKSLFSTKKLGVYKGVTHVKAPNDYVLGTGDEISVSIWGYSEHSGVYTVGNDGSIMPKLVGKIYLKGQSFENARKIIAAKFGRVYDLKNSEISVELNYSKVIRVNIVGEVANPGTYSISSINSLFNILSVAGGIGNHGTVRNISVRREGKEVKVLDVYDFINNPTSKSDFYLLDNDYIVVGIANKVVRISGGVLRPHTYELKEGETISDLIAYAGGFLPSAYSKTIKIHRYQNDRDEILEVNYDSIAISGKKFPLKNGDRVIVPFIPSELRNMVSVGGALNIPGDFVLKEGMLVADLIELAEGLRVDAYLGKAILSRQNADYSSTRIEIDLEKELSGATKTRLQEFDFLTVFSKKDFITEYSVEIKGAVKNPRAYSYSENLTLGDVIFMSGGLLKQASLQRIEISRVLDAQSLNEEATVEVFTVDIENDLLSKANKEIKLKPGDLIYVREIPNYTIQKKIAINGEVYYPGTYVISKNDEKITEFIKRAGGVTSFAFLEGAYLRRRYGEEADDFIVLDLKKLLDGNGKEYDYVLKDGDQLYIPTITNMVSLSGAVDYPKVAEFGTIHTPYKKGKRAKYYINNYGSGFSKNAKRSKTYVETKGGKVKRTRNFLLFKIYPKVKVGDEIYVVAKQQKSRKREKGEKFNWNRFIESVSVKLTGVATLYVILQTAFSN